MQRSTTGAAGFGQDAPYRPRPLRCPRRDAQGVRPSVVPRAPLNRSRTPSAAVSVNDPDSDGGKRAEYREGRAPRAVGGPVEGGVRSSLGIAGPDG